MAFHRLLAQKEPLADLSVRQAVGDQLEHFVLAGGRVWADPGALRRSQRDHVGDRVSARSDRLEARGMLRIPGQDGVALCSVHARRIGVPKTGL